MDNSEELNIFMQMIGTTSIALERIREHIDNHLGVAPYKVTWDEALAMVEISRRARQLLEFIEGEENE